MRPETIRPPRRSKRHTCRRKTRPKTYTRRVKVPQITENVTPEVSLREEAGREQGQNGNACRIGSHVASDWYWPPNLAVCSLSSRQMHVHPTMASRAQCDQILLGIISGSAPELKVVHLEVFGAAADLTAPTVPLQNSPMKRSIRLRSQPNSLGLADGSIHEAFLACSTNCCCCGKGSSPKRRFSDERRMPGLSSSKLAPARKSAQIISRQ